jgi:hypothetical protein
MATPNAEFEQQLEIFRRQTEAGAQFFSRALLFLILPPGKG